MRGSGWIAFSSLVVSMASGATVLAQEEVEWSALRWETQGAVRLEEYLGRPAMRLGSGSARLIGDPFENGTIEYDVAVDGARSFTGIVFREGDSGYEHLYLRPHQTGRFDALQYTPDFNGLSAWQLFPEFNASAVIPRDEWLHVRMVVAGSKLQVYVGDSTEPALDIDGMRRGPGAGAVLLTSFVPGAPEEFLPNAYSNLTIARSSRPVEWKPVGSPKTESGFVREWSVSSPVPGPEGPIEMLSPEALTGLEWTKISADTVGRVNLARLAGRPDGEARGMVFARIHVRSEQDQIKRLDFGFSDQASVFANGQILFAGNNTYRSRSLRYLGAMGVDNDALWVPLKKGDNELVFAVIESFGGWGLTARFPDSTGLTVQAQD